MTALTVSKVFTRVQNLFGDTDQIQITEAMVIDWINDAQREAVMQHEALLPEETTIAAVADQSTYSLPSDLFTLRHVYFDGYMIKYMTQLELNERVDGWRNPDLFPSAVLPVAYTRVKDNEIILFPAPTESGTITVVYSRYSQDVTTTADPIDLPEYYHSYVEHFCMMKAYELDENWDASDRKASILQKTLDFNNAKETWFGRDTFPHVTVMPEDYL